MRLASLICGGFAQEPTEGGGAYAVSFDDDGRARKYEMTCEQAGKDSWFTAPVRPV